jgi:hypothetical protein
MSQAAKRYIDLNYKSPTLHVAPPAAAAAAAVAAGGGTSDILSDQDEE